MVTDEELNQVAKTFNRCLARKLIKCYFREAWNCDRALTTLFIQCEPFVFVYYKEIVARYVIETDKNSKNILILFEYLMKKSVDKDKIIEIYNNVYTYSSPCRFLTFIYTKLEKDLQLKILEDRIKRKCLHFNGIPNKYDNLKIKFVYKWSEIKSFIKANLFNLGYLSRLNLDSYEEIGFHFSKYIINKDNRANWLKRKIEEEKSNLKNKENMDEITF